MAYAFEVHTGTDSGLLLKYVPGLDITLSKYDPVNVIGSSYIPLPDKVVRSGGVINMKNKDQECFKHAVTRFLNPVSSNPERVTKLLREQAGELDWSGVAFPTHLVGGSIGRFERNNNIGVFVMGIQGDKYVPLRAPGGDYERVVDIFYFRNKEGESHYACIKSLSRLLYSSRSKGHHKLHFCRYCLSSFYSEKDQMDHTRIFSKHKCTSVTMPKKGRFASL